jgi:hypothetical protein
MNTTRAERIRRVLAQLAFLAWMGGSLFVYVALAGPAQVRSLLGRLGLESLVRIVQDDLGPSFTAPYHAP